MNIALDYDDTYTRDPKLWLGFIKAATAAEHDIRIVTMRFKHEFTSMDPALLETRIPIIFTSSLAKQPECERHGFHVHVWIDDNPRAINESAAQIWGVR
jgi:hypothetical protein